MSNHGKELEKLILHDKRTHEAIAKKMGYSRMTLNRLIHTRTFTPKQLAVVSRVYDISIITSGTETQQKVNVKSELFSAKTIEDLKKKIAELESENEETKNDLRSLNKRFNDLVFSLATGTKKGGKAPSNQRDLFSGH